MKPFPHIVCTLALAGMMIPGSQAATVQSARVYATGLMNPSKVIAIGGGELLVSEAGQTPNSGRVSLIMSGGARQTLIDGLPSGLAAPDNTADGPNGLSLSGQTLYIAIGEGDSFVNGPSMGTIVANPAGPSSPIFASVLQVVFDKALANIGGSFHLQATDHATLLDGDAVTLDDGAGDQATLTLLAQFRPGVPDPRTIYRNSHPYGLTLNPHEPDYLYVADAGMNNVRQVSLSSGQTRTLTRFAPSPDPVKGPPTIEAVPTSVQPYGTGLLVSLLSGAPFVSGQSRVMLVDAASGQQSTFMALLTSNIDVATVDVPGGRPVIYALEYSANLPAGAPGILRRYDTDLGYDYADGLNSPTSMAVDATAKTIYITDRTDGEVLAVPII